MKKKIVLNKNIWVNCLNCMFGYLLNTHYKLNIE